MHKGRQAAHWRDIHSWHFYSGLHWWFPCSVWKLEGNFELGKTVLTTFTTSCDWRLNVDGFGVSRYNINQYHTVKWAPYWVINWPGVECDFENHYNHYIHHLDIHVCNIYILGREGFEHSFWTTWTYDYYYCSVPYRLWRFHEGSKTRYYGRRGRVPWSPSWRPASQNGRYPLSYYRLLLFGGENMCMLDM